MATSTTDGKSVADRLRETAKGGLAAKEYQNVVANRDLLFEAAIQLDVQAAEIKRLRQIDECPRCEAPAGSPHCECLP